MKHLVLILLASIAFTISCVPPPEPVEPEVNWKKVLPGQYTGELEIKTDLDSLHYSQISFCIDDFLGCKLNHSRWGNTLETTISLNLKKTESGYEIIYEKNKTWRLDTVKLSEKLWDHGENDNYFKPVIDGAPDLFGHCYARYWNDSIFLSIHCAYFIPTDSAREIRFGGAKPL